MPSYIVFHTNLKEKSVSGRFYRAVKQQESAFLWGQSNRRRIQFYSITTKKARCKNNWSSQAGEGDLAKLVFDSLPSNWSHHPNLTLVIASF